MNNRDSGLGVGGIISLIGVGIVTLLLVVGLLFGLGAAKQSYSRHQRLANAHNQVKVTEITIANTKQLVDVENEKANVRIADAHGIAEAQRIISGTLNGAYLQYLSIQAQIDMANGSNHTVVYIPVGNEGIPLVGTTNTVDPSADVGN